MLKDIDGEEEECCEGRCRDVVSGISAVERCGLYTSSPQALAGLVEVCVAQREGHLGNSEAIL